MKKRRCQRCKKMKVVDGYKGINEFNKRVYCNDCIDIIWEEFIINKEKELRKKK